MRRKTVGLYGKVLSVLEINSEELGAKYVEGEIFRRHAVRDERLVAGQNLMSSVICAGLALESLEWFLEADRRLGTRPAKVPSSVET